MVEDGAMRLTDQEGGADRMKESEKARSSTMERVVATSSRRLDHKLSCLTHVQVRYVRWSEQTQQALERIIKFHSIPALTKYIRSRSLPISDIDGWRMKNLLQRIFLSSDPDNEGGTSTGQSHQCGLMETMTPLTLVSESRTSPT
jgi:hypothetical protein